MFQHGPTQLESVFGRLTVGGPDTCSITNTCEYDQEGRLTKACKAASCTTGTPDRVEFTYDGEGHRIEERDYTAGTLTTTRTFRYLGDAIVEETTNGTITRSYLVDDAGTILRVCDPDCASPGATSYLPVWNGHGDATALYRINGDGTLTLANSYTYSTWGTPTTATHNGIADQGFRFLYVGAHDVQWDNAYGLGLTYMHARHYSPVVGRFLQPDPARAEPNLYGYAGDSPVAFVDPSGLALISLGLAYRGNGFYLMYQVWREYSWIDHALRGFVAPTLLGWAISFWGGLKAGAFALGWWVGAETQDDRSKVHVGDRRRAWIYWDRYGYRVYVKYDYKRNDGTVVRLAKRMIFKGGPSCARDVAHALNDSWNDDFMKSCKAP